MDDALMVAWAPVLTSDRSAEAHALLRRTVTALTGVPAGEQVLLRACGTCGGPHGAPVLVHPRLFVSLSSTATVVVIAVTTAGPVGVDVEPSAATWFAGLLTGTPQERACAWTTTEAAGTARGTGLASEPDLTGLQLYDVPVAEGLVCTAALLSDHRPPLRVTGPAGWSRPATAPVPPVRPGRRGPGTVPC